MLYRSPGVFVGYYKNDDATKETKTELTAGCIQAMPGSSTPKAI